MSEVTITGSGLATGIVGRLENGELFRTFAPSQMERLVDLMLDQGVKLDVRGGKSWTGSRVCSRWTTTGVR